MHLISTSWDDNDPSAPHVLWLHSWDVEGLVDISQALRLEGGCAAIGVMGTGLCDENYLLSRRAPAQPSQPRAPQPPSRKRFSVALHSVDFTSKQGLAATSVSAISVTSERLQVLFPDVARRVADLVSALNLWSALTVQLSFPPALAVLFDTETCSAYTRIFKLLFRVEYTSL